GESGEGMAFADLGEIERALDQGVVTLHTRVKARYHGVDKDNQPIVERIETTPGRMILAQLLPRHPNVSLSLINRLMTKREITEVIDIVYRHCGQKETVIFADRLMALGFSH